MSREDGDHLSALAADFDLAMGPGGISRADRATDDHR
jgi:hypothetical protein